MKTALILIDLQKDYLASKGLEPAAGTIVGEAAKLLADSRARKQRIIHVRTTVTREPDNRMAHWIEQNKWMCVRGTVGHEFAGGLEPMPGEGIVEKTHFSGFQDGTLETLLRASGIDQVILAGVHLHACIRSTALDAYARGFQVFIRENAVGSDDPLHAAITQRYLKDRAIRFTGNEDAMLGMAGALHNKVVSDVPDAIAGKAVTLRRKWVERSRTTLEERAAVLERVADALELSAEEFARQICADVYKPITLARGEVRRSCALLRATARGTPEPLEYTTESRTLCRRQPLGVVAIITPWNNPLAIPVGKIAPSFLFGNATLWKPSPDGSRVASMFLELWRKTGGGDLEAVYGYRRDALCVASDPHVDAITFTGSEAGGLAMQEIAARRRVPLQAELGGNNAAIVAEDADIDDAARLISEGAFGFAGQRCTANRRVIILRGIYEKMLTQLVVATGRMRWGDPWHESTLIGPVISVRKNNELVQLKNRLSSEGMEMIHPHPRLDDENAETAKGFYVAPVLVICDDPRHEIVQEESFGPILVVQRAQDFDEAMGLCNGVRQGLVAALFSKDKSLQQRFLREAQAGILKINQATADADAVSPFGGWKASGIGPAEHGIADREFFTRMQTIYHA